MKRFVTLLLAIIMCVSLCACGKSDAAANADKLIEAVGTVTLESGDAITAAESAVAALAEEDAKQVEGGEQLKAARTSYDALVVEDAVNAIGTVTLESGDAITSARSAYDAASAEAQAAVTNYAVLEAAEQEIADLQIKTVTDEIAAIGTVTMESAEQVAAARESFDALSAENQGKVTNADALQAAEEQLSALKKEAALALMSGMYHEEDRVRGLDFYYAKTFQFYSDGSWAADQRCFILPYMGMEGDRVWLRLVCNYTDSDWVFFEKLTFAVDDERYYKLFSYSDVVRDNGGWRVWEYVDIEVSDDDVEMLWAIANSEETIVRFEGDDYSFDYTIPATDKQAIADLLTAYQALS
jgi:hypothetical protein